MNELAARGTGHIGTVQALDPVAPPPATPAGVYVLMGMCLVGFIIYLLYKNHE